MILIVKLILVGYLVTLAFFVRIYTIKYGELLILMRDRRLFIIKKLSF